MRGKSSDRRFVFVHPIIKAVPSVDDRLIFMQGAVLCLFARHAQYVHCAVHDADSGMTRLTIFYPPDQQQCMLIIL